jgi:nitrile hydratase
VDGVHDLGGMHGFGAIPIETDEPLFHEPWQARGQPQPGGPCGTGFT